MDLIRELEEVDLTRLNFISSLQLDRNADEVHNVVVSKA